MFRKEHMGNREHWRGRRRENRRYCTEVQILFNSDVDPKGRIAEDRVERIINDFELNNGWSVSYIKAGRIDDFFNHFDGTMTIWSEEFGVFEAKIQVKSSSIAVRKFKGKYSIPNLYFIIAGEKVSDENIINQIKTIISLVTNSKKP